MRSVEIALRDRIELREKFSLRRDRKCDAEEFGALDFVTKLDSVARRAVVIVYIALRSRMGCAIASSTIRSITSP
jgi:hypothetical protein